MIQKMRRKIRRYDEKEEGQEEKVQKDSMKEITRKKAKSKHRVKIRRIGKRNETIRQIRKGGEIYERKVKETKRIKKTE